MSRPPARALARLSQLLEQERSQILAGRYDGLEAIATRKAALLSRIEAADPGPDALAPVVAQLRRNQELTGAACAGMRDALSALKEARGRGQRLETYGPDGRQSLDCSATRGPVRRA